MLIREVGPVRLVLSLALLVPGLAVAAPPRVSPEAYDRAVDLVDRLYLHPEQLDADGLLVAAAEGLADELHWLIVDADDGAVYLRHGDGTPIGQVSVASMATLPEALRSLEQVVVDSQYEIGDVDVRLEILKGMTGALDRYSRVLAGEKLDRFDVRLKGTLVGVGATLDTRDGRLVVSELTPGGPADLGGLEVGDVILRIDGVSTVNMPLRDATNKIRGEVDTPIVLTVQRGQSETIDLSLVRREVVVPNVKVATLADGVGYLRIDHFSQRTVENLVAAMDELRKKGALTKGLVLDLRGNTGGSMKEAARSADEFVSDGLLISTRGPDGQRVQSLQHEMTAEPGTEPQIPIVLLVDDQTASGSEILAGALLQLDRAVAVGYTTFGKGTVQKIYNLDEDARLKLTVAEYILAGDRRIVEGGIVPDVVVGAVEVGALGVRYHGWEEEEAGVPWDAIVPTLYQRPTGSGTDAWLTGSNAFAVEVARRTVLRAGPGVTDRAATLAALQDVLPQVRAEQEQKLVRALEARGIDWSEAPASSSSVMAPPRAVARLTTSIDPTRPDVVEVAVEVENTGAEALHRVLVEVECDTFDPWSGLVIPVGRVEPGETGRGKVGVELKPGVDPREDVVRVKLRADERAPLALDDTVLKAQSSSLPRLAVQARLAGEADARRAEITLINASAVALEDLEVSFAFPGEVGVELLDASAFLPSLAPRSEARVDIGLRIGPTAPAEIPLELVVTAKRYDEILDWPVLLPADGTAVREEAPRVQVRTVDLSAPVGAFTVPVQVMDERALDHVVVYANGAKVAWAGGGKMRLDVEAPVQLRAGVNRVVVVAEDDQGLVSRRTLILRGETPSTTVDAQDE
jgi:carboxyl-terminal processing protease